METTVPPAACGLVSRFNHWLIVAGMIGMLGFGLYIENAGLEGAARGAALGVHKAIGVLVLAFCAWRVDFRLYRGFPAPVAALPAWQEAGAKAVHWLLLVGIVLMPVSGLVMSAFGGRATDVFGVFAIPAGPKIEWLNEGAGEVHSLVGYLLVAVVAAHAGAALKHHVLDRDATLLRTIAGRTVSRD
ncbi:MAG: cytochrome b [Pseudomonadota bacterium]